MFKGALLLLLCPIVALATMHHVHVGQHLITYTPDKIVAQPGDHVTFYYYPGDHGVAEGDYSTPCKPKKGGFWSGFIDSNKGQADRKFVLRVNDTKPIFIYCPNSDHHCQGGMSMVINEGDGMKLGNYKLRSPVTVTSVVPPKVQGGKIKKNN